MAEIGRRRGAARAAFRIPHLSNLAGKLVSSKADHDTAIEALLTRWNEGLQRLKPQISHPDLSIALSPGCRVVDLAGPAALPKHAIQECIY